MDLVTHIMPSKGGSELALFRCILVVFFSLGAANAFAAQARGTGISSKPKIITIRSNRGGMIAKYALAVKKAERENRFVRFVGRCDSACTLYLSLSAKRTCVGPRSSFGFHLPYGVSPRAVAVARDYMLGRYPAWVRNWIRNNGGLSSRLKTMPYSYARRFIPECEPHNAASNDNGALRLTASTR